MKKSYIVAAVSILVVGILLFLSFKNTEESAEVNPENPEPEIREEATSEEPPPATLGDDLPQPVFESVAEAEEFREEIEAKEDPQRTAYLAVFETPIEYYGRVLDEAKIPVVGAEIRFSVLNNPHTPLSPGTQYTQFSDIDGNFSITGITGARLTLKVIKEGYRMISNPQSSVGYHPSSARKGDDEIPTAEQPAIFVLEKLNTPASLIKRRLKHKLSLNGQAVSIDLLSGKVRSGSSFTISLQSDYDSQTYQTTHWEASVKIHDGGLIEHTDLANFEAPGSGYTNEVVFRVTEDMEGRPKSFRQDYYFVTDNGQQYGRGTLYISSSGTFSFSYYLNPEGSRNLQYDRALDVTKQY